MASSYSYVIAIQPEWTCAGRERFRILSVKQEKPVLVCEIELLDEDDDSSTQASLYVGVRAVTGQDACTWSPWPLRHTDLALTVCSHRCSALHPQSLVQQEGMLPP